VKKAEPKPEVAKKEAPKPEPKKMPVKPAKEVKKAEPKPEVAKKEAPKPEPKKMPVKPAKEEKKAEPKLELAKKETSKPAGREGEKKPMAEEQKKTLIETAKKEEKKTDTLLYNVSKVSIIEAKSKSMLVINISNPNGNLDYADEIESKYGKEWLKLRIKPAVNSTDKSFKFTSAYIGEMRIEEDKTGGQNLVNIFIELLPSGVTYDIARIKNTLVLTFSNP